ncbi:MAG: hypothetical protein H6Q91_622 [Deltaproteobacteria bacterium]|nr:hypothetical protein [Deltaproteobacteria bacterium]
MREQTALFLLAARDGTLPPGPARVPAVPELL